MTAQPVAKIRESAARAAPGRPAPPPPRLEAAPASGASTDSWLDPWFPRPTLLAPPLDVARGSDAVVVRCEVPGVAREDLTVEIDDGRLSIAGRKTRSPGPDAPARRQERWFGSFRRDLELPFGTDPNRAEATLGRGILTVRVPLRPDARVRAIPVR